MQWQDVFPITGKYAPAESIYPHCSNVHLTKNTLITRCNLNLGKYAPSQGTNPHVSVQCAKRNRITDAQRMENNQSLDVFPITGQYAPSQGINPRYSNLLLAKKHCGNTRGLKYEDTSFIPNNWGRHPIAKQQSTLSQCTTSKNTLQKLRGCGAFNHNICSH